LTVKILINIDVPELGPAIDFYRSALGLHVTRVIDGDVAELTGASSVLYLLKKPPGSSPAKDLAEVRRYARHWTPVHIDFVVDGVEDAAKRALAAGARQESDCVEWMGSKCITFSDPFGHGFCLIEFTGETYSHGA
jgi:predicted enzyme related to lactoylglutathione lyase